MHNNDNNTSTGAKKKLTLVITVFAILLLVTLIIINKEPLKSFFSVVTAILEPILLGAAIAYILNPVLRFFEFKVLGRVKNKNLVRALSLIITYVIAILILVIAVYFILPKFVESVLDIGRNFNVYAKEITAFINRAIANFTSESEFFDPDQLMSLVGEVISDSEDLFDSIVSRVVNLGVKFFNIVKNVILALFISVYMLIGKERLYAKATKTIKAISSESTYTNVMKYARISNSTFGKYFVGKILDSFLVAVISLILLLIFRFPYAVLISLVIGACNIIPYLGIIVGIILSSIIVLIAEPSNLLAFLLLMIIVQQIDSNIIAPKILGRQTGISSLGVILAIVLMGGLFGVVGMIIAVPIFAILFTIIKEYAETRLEKKGLKTSTVDYYDDSSFSVESKPHRTVAKVFIDAFLKIKEKLVRKNKNKEKND